MKYYLYRGDELLGTITHDEDDFPWHLGEFEAAEAFSGVRPLFQKERQFHKQGARDEWEKTRKEIDGPGIRLEPVGGGKTIDKILICIEENSVWWKC